VRVASRALTEKEREKLTVYLHKGAAGDWDFDVLANEFELDDLLEWGFNENELIGLDFSGKDTDNGLVEHSKLTDKFIVPPFSVLDARQGYWQERKRAWILLGIMSELGRGERLTSNIDIREVGISGFTRREADARSNIKNSPKRPEWATGTGTENMASGTSIFDPVLCELIYRWFCPPAGSVLDPFAGGSVRGIVASKLGHPYTGIDLRPEQVEANEAQAQQICEDSIPHWIVGDSRNLATLLPDNEKFDLVFSCPPYFDLEIYSDDNRDLSNAGDYDLFIKDYSEIIARSVERLNDNRFACFVVGDIRDKQGFYRNFVSDTITAFHNAGGKLYNEAILVTVAGSLPIRINKQFQGYRKLGKTHQNVLVFYKGDPRKIKEFGEVEAGDIEQYNSDIDVTGGTPELVEPVMQVEAD